MKQVIASVVSNSEIVLGTHIVWLDCLEIATAAKPGQFVMVHCGHDTLLPRPLSIHQRDGDKVALLFTIVGKGTAWLSQCKAGDNVELFGPLGNGFSVKPTSRNLLLVAGGMGIAPLYSLAEDTSKEGYSVTLLYGTAIKNPYPGETPAIRLVHATEDGSVGKKGKVTDLLPEFADWADQIFACGPLPMYRDMALKKQELGLAGKSVQISLEVVMGCGHGVCYGCTIRTEKGLRQVCKDGPVFELDDISWDEWSFGN